MHLLQEELEKEREKSAEMANRLANMEKHFNTLNLSGQSGAQVGPSPADGQAMRQMQDMLESALKKVSQMEAKLNDSKEQQPAMTPVASDSRTRTKKSKRKEEPPSEAESAETEGSDEEFLVTPEGKQALRTYEHVGSSKLF